MNKPTRDALTKYAERVKNALEAKFIILDCVGCPNCYEHTKREVKDIICNDIELNPQLNPDLYEQIGEVDFDEITKKILEGVL